MINSNTINSVPINLGTPPSTLERDLIEFDGYSFMSLCPNSRVYEKGTGGVIVKTINKYDLANINLSTFISGLTDGGGVNNKRYTDLTLSLDLFFEGVDFEDLVNKIEEFKKETQKTEGDLTFKQPNGHIRTVRATLTDLKVGSLNSLENFKDEVTATFRIFEPHIKDEKTTSLLYEGITANSQQVINYSGTYKTFPKFIFVFGTGNSGVSKVEIEVKQPGDTTGFKLDVETTINDGDLLIFDGETKTVTLNQAEIDFNGIFEPLLIGNNFLDFNFTKTSLDVDIAVLYNNTYL